MKKELKALTRQQRISGTIGLALILAVAGTSGCSKKKDSASTPPPQTASTTETNQAPAPTAPPPAQAGAAAPAVQANGQPDLAEINRAMIRWIVGHRRAPSSFQEFAATAGVTIPPPPPGKKYVLAPNKRVQLADQ